MPDKTGKKLQPFGFFGTSGGGPGNPLHALRSLRKIAGIVRKSDIGRDDLVEFLGFAADVAGRKLSDTAEYWTDGIGSGRLIDDTRKLRALLRGFLEDIPSALTGGGGAKLEARFNELECAVRNMISTGKPFPENEAYPRPGTVPDREDPRPGADPYSFTPFAKDIDERKKAFLEFYAADGEYELLRGCACSVLGRPAKVSDAAINRYTNRLSGRLDCADFYAVHAVFALYVNEMHPFLKISQMEALKEALAGFKYWVDEPGWDRMIFWTENHQLIFHTVEYLAGQMYPETVFTNDGKTGAEHMGHARELALEWMERRARWGYSEWESSEYFAHDAECLALLAEYAGDADLAAAAAVSLDLLLFDVSCDLFHGFYACTHGRAYEDEILSGRDYDMASLVKVVWGTGTFAREGRTAALVMSAASRFRTSEAVIRAGQASPEEFHSLQRHGISIDQLDEYGIDSRSLDDVITIWGMGAVTQPEVVDLMVRAADEWNLWEHPFFDIAGNMNRLLPRDGTVGGLIGNVAIESDRTLLGRVYKATYRTPDYMLSCALDYRPGERGNQHHIWQATLGPDAIVFTTCPGSFGWWDEDDSPGTLDFTVDPHKDRPSWNRTPTYWVGQNRLPRVAQYRNIAVVLYDIDDTKAIGERPVLLMTHALFPRWAFDEVTEENGWIFGRAGDGYAGLYSSNPYKWRDPDSEFAHDVVVYSRRNVWLCIMGRRAVDGEFGDFVRRAGESRPGVKDLDVSWQAPGAGEIRFSWTGPFTVDGEVIPLRSDVRFENPYCTAGFDTTRFEIEVDGESLVLDFEERARTVGDGGNGEEQRQR